MSCPPIERAGFILQPKRSIIEQHITTAPHHPSAKLPNIRDFKILETAYRRLHTASEQVDCAEREIGHLEIAKDELYPGECLGQSTFNKYEHWDEDPRKSDWWKRLARTDLLNSAANIDRKLEGLNASKTEFEAVESALRGYINELSRPYLRKLNIQDLPDELLLEIFELMEADDVSFSFPIYGPDTKDIKNSRLVCRRFCDVSSQLLLRHVQVGFNETSLAHLEEVSRHPTIAKGVRSVEVVLHFYSYSFPDLEGFLSYHADGLEKEVNSLEHAKRSEVWKYWLSRINTTEETVLKVIAEGTAIISTLRRLASADHSDGGYSEDDKGHRERLGAIHQQYLNLLTNQESMIRSGKFSRVVNSAMARMPGARKLELKDSDLALLESRGLLPEADVWASLHRLMLQPTGRYDAKLRGIELPNYQRIVEVIGPFRSAAGVLLNSIRIQLNTLGTPGSLALAPDIRQEFSSRMRQLKNFTFCSSYAEDAEDADDLNNFLFACLDTSSLKKLWLKLNGRAQNQAKANLGKIIGSRSRHELTNIYLSGVAIDLSTLVLFLELLPESLSSLGIQLWDVHLLSGTWKEVLDALRKKKSCVMVLRQPRGAECAGMSQKNYRRIFDSNNREPITEFNHGPPSMAEVYIANWCSPALNPLQALEDGFDIPTAN